MAEKSSLENKHLCKRDYFSIIPSYLHPSTVDKVRSQLMTGCSAVEVNRTRNERFAHERFVHVVVKTLNLEILRYHLADYVKGMY